MIKITDKEMYYKLKAAYEMLECDENATEEKLKKSYRILCKRHHPDAGGSETMFKKVQEAYVEINNNGWKYKELKLKYDKTTQSNKYIFLRRDGSKIEIQPLEKNIICDELFYCYKIIQYYNDITIINDSMYGRINLKEIMKNREYCDFCVNSFLSKSNIEYRILDYKGYIGRAGAGVGKKNGRMIYKAIECDSDWDIVDDISKILNDKSKEILLDIEDDYIVLGKVGMALINRKLVYQYTICTFEYYDKSSMIVYGGDIDIRMINKNERYKTALLEKLLAAEEINSKIKDGGYIGELIYNWENDDYEVIEDRDIKEFFKTRNQTKER